MIGGGGEANALIFAITIKNALKLTMRGGGAEEDDQLTLGGVVAHSIEMICRR